MKRKPCFPECGCSAIPSQEAYKTTVYLYHVSGPLNFLFYLRSSESQFKTLLKAAFPVTLFFPSAAHFLFSSLSRLYFSSTRFKCSANVVFDKRMHPRPQHYFLEFNRAQFYLPRDPDPPSAC